MTAPAFVVDGFGHCIGIVVRTTRPRTFEAEREIRAPSCLQ